MPGWFRRTSWTPDDVRDFQARLRRSRTTSHKAQYLRLQALHLAQVGTAELLKASLELLDQLLVEYPDPSQLAAAYQQRGACLADLGRHDEAFAAFEAALEAQTAHKGIRTGVELDYAELAVALRRTGLYPRAEALLGGTTPEERSFFPIVDYRFSGLRHPDGGLLACASAPRAAAYAGSLYGCSHSGRPAHMPLRALTLALIHSVLLASCDSDSTTPNQGFGDATVAIDGRPFRVDSVCALLDADSVLSIIIDQDPTRPTRRHVSVVIGPLHLGGYELSDLIQGNGSAWSQDDSAMTPDGPAAFRPSLNWPGTLTVTS